MNVASLISDGEMKIMNLLWEKSPRTMSDIRKTLESETGWTRFTVISLLKRMLEKQTIRVEEAKPEKLYYPLIEKEIVEQAQTKNLLNTLFSGKITYLVNAMVKQGELDDADIDELRNYLDTIKR